MKKAIIFDLYDTLIEIQTKTKPYLYLLNHLQSTQEISAKELINYIMTNDIASTAFIRQLLDAGILKPTFQQLEFLRLLDEELETTSLISGTYTVLTRLKDAGYKLYVLSNLATPYKYPFYNLHLEKWIDKAFFSCELKDKKPNASFFQKVLDYSGLQKEDLIMIGDNHISDVKGALDFGIDAILKDKDLNLLTQHL